MAKFTKLNIGDAVASSGGRVWKKLSAESAEPAESIVGTWVFNTTVSYSEIDSYFSFNVTTASGSVMYRERLRCYQSSGVTKVAFYNASNSPTVVYSDKWYADIYKTIVITTEPTDEAFITWLKANATKQ